MISCIVDMIVSSSTLPFCQVVRSYIKSIQDQAEKRRDGPATLAESSQTEIRADGPDLRLPDWTGSSGSIRRPAYLPT
jgi:hypothetical protein